VNQCRWVSKAVIVRRTTKKHQVRAVRENNYEEVFRGGRECTVQILSTWERRLEGVKVYALVQWLQEEDNKSEYRGMRRIGTT